MNICSNCGASIKNMVIYNNKPYGTDCILTVTGMRAEYWVIKDGTIDTLATEQREQARLALLARSADAQTKAVAEKAANILNNQWIIDALNNEPSDPVYRFKSQFVCSVVESLECGKSVSSFSDRQKSAIAEILAKQTAKKGSKLFKQNFESLLVRLS